MIATEHGYDLYVAGNGGMNPRHGALLASGIDGRRLAQVHRPVPDVLHPHS